MSSVGVRLDFVDIWRPRLEISLKVKNVKPDPSLLYDRSTSTTAIGSYLAVLVRRRLVTSAAILNLPGVAEAKGHLGRTNYPKSDSRNFETFLIVIRTRSAKRSLVSMLTRRVIFSTRSNQWRVMSTSLI